MSDAAERTRFSWKHGIGIVLSLAMLYPIIWVVSASFKTRPDSDANPLSILPRSFTLEKYRAVWNFSEGLASYALNSILLAAMTVCLTVVLSVLAAYGFSKTKFVGRGVLFALVMLTIMVPFPSLVTPLFVVLNRLGLADSLFGLCLVYTTFQLPFSIFVMKNAFDSVPVALSEAGQMDGAGHLQILLRILSPISVSGIVTVALFAFLSSWNEFFAALIFLSDGSKYTLPIMLLNSQSGLLGSVDWGSVQAGVAVTMIPCLALFLLLQRYYVGGLSAGAVK